MKKLCSEIVGMMENLPEHERISYTRVYNKTWNLVSLTQEGLAIPTKDAKTRLQDLHAALRQRLKTK